ncbi:MAG: Spy/CpxP family protein refolding chaperone [Phycisphaerae bacterium]|nr:Spy/CpxP family protein refolding chaperone [Phycisphaerae bacterium]
MSRARSAFIVVITLSLSASFLAAEGQQRRGGRRGMGGMGGPGPGRATLLGLLSMPQVQKDLKLTDDQTPKVKKIIDDLRAEMRQEFSTVRGMDDRAKQRAKMTELSDQFDAKASAQLKDVLTKEQTARLDQIRVQSRPTIDALADKDVAAALKLTDDQKAKLDQINKDMRAEQTKLFAGMQNVPREQRAESFQKYRKLREDADKNSLDVLTAEQKAAFEKMKGEKIDLQMPRGGRGGRAPARGF